MNTISRAIINIFVEAHFPLDWVGGDKYVSHIDNTPFSTICVSLGIVIREKNVNPIVVNTLLECLRKAQVAGNDFYIILPS